MSFSSVRDKHRIISLNFASLFRVFVFLLVFSLLTLDVAAQQTEQLLNYGIVGSESGGYSSAVRQREMQKLLLDIAVAPRKPEYIDAALKKTKTTRNDLEKLGLVRSQGDGYVINFTLFTKSDVAKLHERSALYAQPLAKAILENRMEIDVALRRYDMKGVDPKAIAYNSPINSAAVF